MILTKTKSWVILASLTVSVLVLGCDEGRPSRVQVSGRVLIDGEPLRFGSVMFVTGSQRPAGGSLDDNGEFFLSCYDANDGAILGEYQVKITGVESLSESSRRWHAPPRYSDLSTSELTATIEEPTSDILFELTWGNKKSFVERWGSD